MLFYLVVCHVVCFHNKMKTWCDVRKKYIVEATDLQV